MTDLEYEAIYIEGRTAFRHDYGHYGWTLYVVLPRHTQNPYRGVKAIIWEKGYRQDVRRLSTREYEHE